MGRANNSFVQRKYFPFWGWAFHFQMPTLFFLKKFTMIPKSYSFGIKLKKIIAAIFMPSKTLGCGHSQNN
jgi:hypothetical protein